MVEIVKLDAYREASDSSTITVENERFLVDEGLELLAAYRSITDTKIRTDLLAFVKSLGAKSP